MEIVNDLPRWNGGDHLFSSTGGRTAVSGFSAGKERLDRAVLRRLRERDPEANPLPHWTPHDFRRVVHSQLGELRVPIDIRERVLGHAVAGLRKTYDKHDYFDEKREALEQWAIRVRSLVQ
jgi:integrase